MSKDIRFTVLGAVRVMRGEADFATGAPQQQALLAALLLRSGRAAAAHELIAAIWGEAAPDSALASLRTYAWRLRRIVEEDRSTPRRLVSLRDGYQLLVDPDAVDAVRAEELAAGAVRARDAGDEAECGRLLTEALALWQGEPLAGVPGPFAEQQRSRLVALRLTLIEERFDHHLRERRHELLIPELIAFTHEYPMQERPYGFLMRALYATGRQAEALAAFGRARHVLAEELGIDPGPELCALHERILASDPLLLAAPRERGVVAVEPPAAEPPQRPPTGRPAQLPPATADFTGRAAALDALCDALGSPERVSLPVVSITGMGGIGKSTLAVMGAHLVKRHFPDGQLYVDLRGNSLEPADPGTVLGSFLTALGVPGPGVPTSPEDRARLLRTTLDGRRVLLTLDNARDPAQIRPLLPGSAECGVIVTSRARLTGLPATFQTDLDVFDTEEALGLLREVAGAQRVAEEPGAAVELVALCGHLPLAVRIMAARLAARPRWTIASMTGRLADERRRISELRAGDLAVAAAFELGYHQLTGDQASSFRLLAPVTRAGIGLESAAAALGLDPMDAEELLESLVDAAMLEAPLPSRYRYHDLVRSFALQLGGEHPAASGDGPDGTEDGTREGTEEGAVLRRLLDHLLAGACAAFQIMVPGDPVGAVLGHGVRPRPAFPSLAEARAWVVSEFDCATTAIALAARSTPGRDPRVLRTAADLLVCLTPFARDVSYTQLAAAARMVAETAALQGDDQAEGRARFVCGNAALHFTQLAEAELHARLATDACRRVGDKVILRQLLNDRGLIAQYQQRYGDAVECYDRAIELARELGHRSGELVTTLNAAHARLRSGLPEEAAASCERVLAQLHTLEDPHGISYAWYVHGMAMHEAGRYPEAVTSFTRCLDMCGSARIRGREAQARFRLAETLRVRGSLDVALAEAERALALCEELGLERERGHSLLVIGQVLADLGDREAGLARLKDAQSVFARLGLPEAHEATRIAGLLSAPADA
ncbi:BTAD domain-containing putative transcriptional regulator [Streptomyces sp. NPDC006632]|uniref:AfsR/SARP family transcriptional regulator n=1 Tax=unclassified Streptomyces TaxID=2593676 RepID=UPI002E1CA88C